MALRNTLARLLAPEDRSLREEKASQTGALIALHGQGQPVWTPRNYTDLAREGYAKNAVVYRCVRMVSEARNTHSLLKLISQPNATQCAPDLFESWYGYLLVAGNAYMEAVSVSGQVRELHVLRPDRMKVIPGPDGWPEAFEYTASGQSVRFPQDVERGQRPILHMTLFHPDNDHYGMSPLEAAATAVDIHNASSSWNKALLDNSARPSGALVYQGKDGALTGEQYDRLKEELESGFQGSSNAGRPLLLEGGLDWKAMSLSPKDMDFIEAKYVAAREIALALGVPPMLLGIPGDNTFANYQEANRSLWRQTVLPLVNRTTKALAGWLGEGVELKPDLDKIEALSSEREALWERVKSADFLTVNEKRALVGYGPMEGDDPQQLMSWTSSAPSKRSSISP